MVAPWVVCVGVWVLLGTMYAVHWHKILGTADHEGELRTYYYVHMYM